MGGGQSRGSLDDVVDNAAAELRRRERLAENRRQSSLLSRRGVTIAWLQKFYTEACEVPALSSHDFSTLELVEKHIIPATASKACSYHDTFCVDDTQKDNNLDVFVSHSWSCSFGDLVRCLKRRFGHGVVVWIDVFAVNQHRGALMDADLKGLVRVIAEAERTVVVVDKDSKCFTRAWCLLEMHTALCCEQGPFGGSRSRRRASVMMKSSPSLPRTRRRSSTSSMRASLESQAEPLVRSERGVDLLSNNKTSVARKKLQNLAKLKDAAMSSDYAGCVGKLELLPYLIAGADSSSEISKLLYDLDVSKAVASVEADAEKIKAAIAEQTGIAEFNEVLKHALAESFAMLPPILAMTAECTPEELAGMALLAGKVLDSGGNYTKAITLSSLAVGLYEEIHTRRADIRMAQALSNLGLSHYNAKMHKESADMHNRAMEIRQRLLGPDHPDVASSCNSLSLVKLAENKLDEAEDLQRRALAIKEIEFGPDSEELGPVLNSLARVMQQRGDLDQAEKTFSRALKIFIDTLGEIHPFTGASVYYLGGVSEERGNLQEAIGHFRRAKVIWESAVGLTHMFTTAANSKLLELLLLQGGEDSIAEAKETLIPAIRMQNSATLESENAELATTVSKLAKATLANGEIAEAVDFALEASRMSVKARGASHPETAKILHIAGNTLAASGRPQAALKVYYKAIEILIDAEGACPLSTVTLMADTAAQHEAEGSRDTALDFLHSAEEKLQEVSVDNELRASMQQRISRGFERLLAQVSGTASAVSQCSLTAETEDKVLELLSTIYWDSAEKSSGSSSFENGKVIRSSTHEAKCGKDDDTGSHPKSAICESSHPSSSRSWVSFVDDSNDLNLTKTLGIPRFVLRRWGCGQSASGCNAINPDVADAASGIGVYSPFRAFFKGMKSSKPSLSHKSPHRTKSSKELRSCMKHQTLQGDVKDI